MDFLQAIFGGTSKVYGVGRPDGNRARQARIHFDDALDDGRRKRQPTEPTRSRVPFELKHKLIQIFLIDRLFPQLAMKSGNCLGLAMQTTSDCIGGGQGSYFFPTGVPDIETYNVTGIKVQHQPRSSRSWEIAMVLSVPWPVLPLSSSLLKPWTC